MKTQSLSTIYLQELQEKLTDAPKGKGRKLSRKAQRYMTKSNEDGGNYTHRQSYALEADL